MAQTGPLIWFTVPGVFWGYLTAVQVESCGRNLELCWWQLLLVKIQLAKFDGTIKVCWKTAAYNLPVKICGEQRMFQENEGQFRGIPWEQSYWWHFTVGKNQVDWV